MDTVDWFVCMVSYWLNFKTC